MRTIVCWIGAHGSLDTCVHCLGRLIMLLQSLLTLQMLVVLVHNVMSGHLPRFGLGPEMLVVILVLLMQHWLISLWLTVVQIILIEQFVATLEQIELWIEQVRITMLIQSPIRISQELQPLFENNHKYFNHNVLNFLRLAHDYKISLTRMGLSRTRIRSGK